jgi:hypothetical protein
VWQTERPKTPPRCSVALLRRPGIRRRTLHARHRPEAAGPADAALREFREAIRINPSFTEAYTSIGQRSPPHGIPRARRCLRPAQRLNRIKADSQAAVFAVNAGRERLQKGDLRGGIARFREAVRLARQRAGAPSARAGAAVQRRPG